MIPSSNTMMEVDFVRGLPGGMTLHTARMFMRDTTREGEERMLDEFAIPAARELGTAYPSVIVFGCTSAGALRGNDYDAELCARISEVAGAPAISTIQSVRSAISSSGARRVGIVTPYVDELNAKVKASIEDDGVEVVRIAGLGMTENFAIAQVLREAIVEFTVTALSGVDIDLVFASCTNFGAMSAMDGIRDRLGHPVITSNQAVLAATIARIEQDLAA
ncbi:Asp/Glu racemase [Saccharopolyspora sp. 5N102]|uniref:aspartate racemase/maleate isomerase family protein n=1 Tax=Saccharopolyspora sp. 5N102 TaxID=3375155 RepID=UPI0037BB6493